MGKRTIKMYVAIALVFFGMFLFAGCDAVAEERECVIQYTDDSGTHQIIVTTGMPYVMETIPEKAGYIFMGLYDAEVGGTQYTSPMGASLSPFMDGENMVLFPQFKAKEYSLILDYQGAAVTWERQITVSYGSSLPELPKNLVGEHKEFAGWYTATNCEGIQVADQYGLIPVVSVLNETNFDLSGEYVWLYAGFEEEKHTVTFCFEPSMDTEEVQVSYNTPVSDVMINTRVNGDAVLAWSKTQGGEAFNGKITDDMVLYALEYAPVIEFDSNGGKEVHPIVARAGAAVSLPIPVKELASFSHWEDMQGKKYTAETMPKKSIALKAVWQPKIVFDENGGSNVEDISETAGSKIVLPMPEREGFLFAGWYTKEKEQYISAIMPAAGIVLKAGWYKEKSDTIVVLNSTDVASKGSVVSSPSTKDLCFTFDYKKYFSDNMTHTIKIDWHAKLRINKSMLPVYVDFYSQKQISSTYLIETYIIKNVTDECQEFNFTTMFGVNNDFYICWYTPDATDWTFNNIWLSDFYYTVHYPDTTNLY